MKILDRIVTEGNRLYRTDTLAVASGGKSVGGYRVSGGNGQSADHGAIIAGVGVWPASGLCSDPSLVVGQSKFDQLFPRLHIQDLRLGVAAIFNRKNQCVQHNNNVLLYFYILFFDNRLVRGRASAKALMSTEAIS